MVQPKSKRQLLPVATPDPDSATKKRRGKAPASTPRTRSKATGTSSAGILGSESKAPTDQELVAILPVSIQQMLQGSKDTEDWRVKQRYLAALLFYRVRYFDATHVKAILEAIQPYRSRTIAIPREIEHFKSLIMELQTDICKSHETVARLWLRTEQGQDWLDSLSSRRKQKSDLPHVTPGQVAEDLQLTVKEISSLWTCVLSVVHPDHWSEDSWYDTAGVCDEYIFGCMETASYSLIARMATGLHVGVPAQRTTSVQARIRMLSTISSVDSPDRWPELPTDVVTLPDSPDGWKGYPDFYPVCTENPDFAALLGRFGDLGTRMFTKLTNRPFPIDGPTTRAVTPTFQGGNASKDAETPHSTAASTHAPADDIQASQDSTAEVPSSSQLKAEDFENVDIPGDNAQHGDKAIDLTGDDITEDQTSKFILDHDGHEFTLATYDDEDEPDQSSWMQTGDEQEKFDDDAMKYLARLAGSDREEDYKIINEWLAYNNPDLTFITARAFELARLGGLGLARYALDDLQSDAAMYGRLADWFAERRVGRLAEAVDLAETMKVVQSKLTNLEAEAASYRSTSGAATKLQQNLTQNRRIMARVQAQVQGARVQSQIQNSRLPMAMTSRNGRGSMAPPDIPGRLGRQSTAPPLGTSSSQSRRGEQDFDETDWAA